MARFFNGLFGSSQNTQPPATSLRVNSSLQGVPVALILGGANRVAGNLLDYFNFNYQNAPQAQGGKGGVFSPGSGKGNSGQYVYFTSFILGLCEGPIAAITGIWMSGNVEELPNTGETSELNWGLNYTFACELFLGDYAQTAWGYTEAVDPAHALAYRGIATANFGNFPLGSSTSLPNLTFQVESTNSGNVVPGQPDGDVSIAFSDFLTNVHWGVGLPSFRLGSLSSWQQYCIALGFGVSPVLASSTEAASVLNDLTAATDAAACWQDGTLTVVPYGDATVTAGAVTPSIETYVVPTGPTYPNPPNPDLEYPLLTVSFAGRFVSDGGVTYESGAPLARVTSYAPTGVAGSG